MSESLTLGKAAELIGQRVRYISSGGHTVEDGVITSVNARYVFVKFNPDHEHGQACVASMLQVL